MAPHFSKPRFWAKFHLGMVVDILFFQKWHLAQGHAQPGPGTGPVWGPLGVHGRAGGRAGLWRIRFHDPYAGVGALGPIWGGTLGALGPIWGGSSGRPKADIMEAEGRLNGGLGAKPPGNWGPWALLGPNFRVKNPKIARGHNSTHMRAQNFSTTAPGRKFRDL